MAHLDPTSAKSRPTSQAVARRDAVQRQLILPLTDISEPTESRVLCYLQGFLEEEVRLTFTKNRTTMISASRRPGHIHVRLHACFADAPDEVLDAVLLFLRNPKTPKPALRPIHDWLHAKAPDIDQTPPAEVPIQPYGQYHDLKRIQAALNQQYFEDTITAQITWSRATRGQKRRTMRLGSYCDRTGVIRIHPALDQAFVPQYFVASVVFHEMLHELHRVPYSEGKRRTVHSRAFLEDERQFAHYEKARRWEKKNLKRLLRF